MPTITTVSIKDSNSTATVSATATLGKRINSITILSSRHNTTYVTYGNGWSVSAIPTISSIRFTRYINSQIFKDRRNVTNY